MPADDCTVNIELTPEQIKARSDSEKLAIMIEVGFSNHKAIMKITELLEGNGKPGLCEQVRQQKKQLAWLWTSFGVVAGFLGSMLVNHVMK